jgi:hypothetical protein
MSIANELSSEVAAAVLTGRAKGTTVSARELIDVIVRVHSTLRRLTTEARKDSRQIPKASMSASAATPTGN